MSDQIYRVKKFDLRSVDFHSGRKVAPPKTEWKTCSCCGQAIVKGWEMSNGHVVGEDCENIIDRFNSDRTCNGATVESFQANWERKCGKLKKSVIDYLQSLVPCV